MNDEPLMEAVVQMVLFLECSNPETIDEDAAIGAMEQMAATLQGLGAVEKERFLKYLKQRAASGSSRERQSIESLASNLSLT